MRLNRFVMGFGVALAAAAFVAPATDAEARGGRGRRGRRNAHFRSQPGPARANTPAVDSNGAADSSRAPVAGAALEGAFRQDILDGGALLAMSPDRALVLNSYRGLLLVDTGDPSAPRVLASVSVDGTGRRMFLGSGEVAVLSDVYGADGASTIVTSVAIGGSSLSVAGTASVAGALRDAAREGDELLVVTGDGFYGPIALLGVAGGAENGAPRVANASIPYPAYGPNAASHVARVRIAADGTPSLLGSLTLDGTVLGEAITSSGAVLAVQPCAPGFGFDVGYLGRPGENTTQDPTDPPYYYYEPLVISLVHVTSAADGAPQTAGALDLDGITGIAALDLDGATARVLAYTYTGESLATFDLSGGAPAALDSVALYGWPSAWAFSGGAFVYGTTEWTYEPQMPADPVFDPKGAEEAFGDATNGTASGVAPGGPTSSLRVVDLRDPTSLAADGSADLGAGWLSGFIAVADGVLATRYGYDEGKGDGSTSLVRVDVSDPSAPSVTATSEIGGYVSLGPVLGDLVLAGGGTIGVDGSYRPFTQIVDLSSGGLSLGGTFSVGSWTTAAAREGDLVGLASFDRLTLVDVGDTANPAVTGEVRLVVNVADFAALDASTGAALTTDYLGGDVEIRTVALPSADALAPLDVLRVATGDAQMFASAPFLYVVATDWSTGRASVHVVDASDPAHLVRRGSLDLARYPGQVFQKGSALLLLREVYSLFDTADDGKARAAPDAFGACPRSWLRQELGAVLDVVDLSDPDAPVAAERLRMRWDFAGQAVLAGNSLYVPSYVDVTLPLDQFTQYSYRIREIDVTNPLRPAARAAVEVPGTLVAATVGPHRVLTAEFAWDDKTGATTSTLHLVDLSLGWQDRVLASSAVDGYPATVTAGRDHAYVVTESWGGVVYLADGVAPVRQEPAARLLTFDLSGPGLALTDTTERDRGAYGSEIAGGCLFLRTWGWTGALDVYSLAAPAAPRFVASRDVAGLAGDVTVVGGRAYVPGGPYGVESFDLSK